MSAQYPDFFDWIDFEYAQQEAIQLWYDETESPSAKLVQIKVNGKQGIDVPVDAWLKTNYFPIGEIYLEPGIVYDCPKHGDEAIEWLYGVDSMFITAQTLTDLVQRGLISISEK
jgi:hypothetical protein